MKTILALILTLTTSLLSANDSIFIDSIEYGGSGCSEDEAWGVFSPDQKTLSVLFDNFYVEAGMGLPMSASTKKCDMKIHVNVPSDKVVIIKKIDYRLFGLVPMRGRARFKSSYNMVVPSLNYVSRTFTKSKTLISGFEDELLIEQPMVTALMKSKCGHNFTLDIKTEITAKTNHLDEEAILSLDSLDGGIVYELEYEECRIGHVNRNHSQRYDRGRTRRYNNRSNRRRY